MCGDQTVEKQSKQRLPFFSRNDAQLENQTPFRSQRPNIYRIWEYGLCAGSMGPSLSRSYTRQRYDQDWASQKPNRSQEIKNQTKPNQITAFNTSLTPGGVGAGGATGFDGGANTRTLSFQAARVKLFVLLYCTVPRTGFDFMYLNDFSFLFLLFSLLIFRENGRI